MPVIKQNLPNLKSYLYKNRLNFRIEVQPVLYPENHTIKFISQRDESNLIRQQLLVNIEFEILLNYLYVK